MKIKKTESDVTHGSASVWEYKSEGANLRVQVCSQTLLKYSAKVALMAEGGWYWGGSPQIYQCMGNTEAFLWECQQFSSTHRTTKRVGRGDIFH